MNSLNIKSDRNILRGKLKQKQAKLSDDKLQYLEGKFQELLGQIQKQTGKIREVVQKSAVGRCEL